MKNLNDILIQIGIFIVVISIIFLITLLMLSQINIQGWNYAKNECDRLNGTLITYECYNSPISNCDYKTMQIGDYCQLPDGSEIDLTIRTAIS